MIHTKSFARLVSFVLMAASIPAFLLVGGEWLRNGVAFARASPGSTQVWTLKAPMIEPRSSHTLSVLNNGLILAVGGNGDAAHGFAELSTAEIYDPGTNKWEATDGMEIPRAGHTATTLADGRVLIAGGRNGPQTPVSLVEIYDPATGKFVSPGRDEHPPDQPHGDATTRWETAGRRWHEQHQPAASVSVGRDLRSRNQPMDADRSADAGTRRTFGHQSRGWARARDWRQRFGDTWVLHSHRNLRSSNPSLFIGTTDPCGHDRSGSCSSE